MESNFDVFRWIASFPRFGSAPPLDVVRQAAEERADPEERLKEDVFRKFGMRPGLERMQEMLRQLGNPERSLRFVHIAGTNGKGSTAAFLAGMFERAGLQTGLYTSPYLTEFHDRMGINGTSVTTDQLTAYAFRLKPVVEQMQAGIWGLPTEFEIVTVLAILYFQDQRADVVIWETGLGGRLDATNVVQPIVTIITNIGLEHTEILGSTEELIAKEKAGIVKPQIPLFTAAVGKGRDVIVQIAKERHAPVYEYAKDFAIVREWADELGQRGYFHTYTKRGLLDVYGISLQMHGWHQTVNASLAIAAYQWCIRNVFTSESMLHAKSEHLGGHWQKFVRNTVRVGVRMMKWAGRFEVIQRHPLWILDGAHNPHGAQALGRTLGEWQKRNNRRILLIAGVLKDKDATAILAPVLPLVHACIATQPDTPRALSAARLAESMEGIWKGPIGISLSVDTALEQAKDWIQRQADRSSEEIMVLCMGSLYTIAEARKHIVNFFQH
ncbi:bifunctional folylpolyglutamate synthase/dihydrofolate synthase [Fodinisporobacter ferrooxydans]|uniref:tetrahydrofolate synthase n=1 Tax=Fodinisporobacter ferrooxydans TaxID=2901836 RepID=A0ABY4CID4_9BACL|nr:bifunctional folylpolyglutamate synthase/dihydrofolate synthase [Alicyclobacillaceae bacterium MYW30-H2]